MSANKLLPFQLNTIRDLQISGRTVFLRVDFNVPLSTPNEQGERHVEDETRIQEALPTIRLAIEKGAKIIIASHLGRPQGRKNPEFSLEPIASCLAEMLGKEVTLANDCVGEGIELMSKSLKNGQILLLENLRFYPGEEANDPEFSKRLSHLAEVYISDAFGAVHRKHASTYGVPTLLLERGIGLLIEKELAFLDPLLHQPKRPFYALLGGSKVTDKMKTVASLIRKVDGLMIGGAMAHAFWAAQGDTVPSDTKPISANDVEAARLLMKDAKRREIPLLLPSDTVKGFDIGPETLQKFSNFLQQAGTIFWNGPLGWFENADYSHGTFEIAKAIAQTSAIKIVGGGDTVSAVKKSGFAEKYDHLSTGGGALLEYLEGNGLPGIEILRLTHPQLAKLQNPVLEE